MSSVASACYHCARALADPVDYGRGDTCPGCRRDTRVCRNCLHYDRTHYNECREPQADRVVEKDRSNFCDYFKPTAPSTARAVDVRSAAEALFKKKN